MNVNAISRPVRTKQLFVLLFCSVLSLLLGCGGSASTQQSTSRSSTDPAEVVFLGSSQVIEWDLARSFPGKDYFNSGHVGDSSGDMLARMDHAVIERKARVVVIWAGENDIQHGLSIDQLHANIAAMRQKAADAGVHPVFCTLAPKTSSSAAQNPAIVEFNDWLRNFVANNAATLADFYPVLVTDSGVLNANYSFDGQHLTDAGYAVITPLVQAAINKAAQ